MAPQVEVLLRALDLASAPLPAGQPKGPLTLVLARSDGSEELASTADFLRALARGTIDDEDLAEARRRAGETADPWARDEAGWHRAVAAAELSLALEPCPLASRQDGPHVGGRR